MMTNQGVVLTLASFVTGMRAASLVEDLEKAGIKSQTFTPKWTNKKLPPPKVAVVVHSSDLKAAKVVLAKFNSYKK